jgi:hypothetical protein
MTLAIIKKYRHREQRTDEKSVHEIHAYLYLKMSYWQIQSINQKSSFDAQIKSWSAHAKDVLKPEIQ